ncbi:hypothetical protein TNCV_2844291 [Trichonephila clavipes]|nr:hypothetical protein TNCV_2844291 [Trichonephila clavipes]
MLEDPIYSCVKKQAPYKGAMFRNIRAFTVPSIKAKGYSVTHESVLQSIIQSSPVCAHVEGNCSTVEDGIISVTTIANEQS